MAFTNSNRTDGSRAKRISLRLTLDMENLWHERGDKICLCFPRETDNVPEPGTLLGFDLRQSVTAFLTCSDQAKADSITLQVKGISIQTWPNGNPYFEVVFNRQIQLEDLVYTADPQQIPVLGKGWSDPRGSCNLLTLFVDQSPVVEEVTE